MCSTMIPLCHKCSDAEIVQLNSIVSQFVGCKADPKITDARTAMEKCPLTHEKTEV